MSNLFSNLAFQTEQDNTKPFTFIDLFAGIGDIRMGASRAGGKCVFSSENDKKASCI